MSNGKAGYSKYLLSCSTIVFLSYKYSETFSDERIYFSGFTDWCENKGINGKNNIIETMIAYTSEMSSRIVRITKQIDRIMDYLIYW